MTTALRKRLGRIPYRYSVEDQINDYQVVVNGPAGRAVITEIDGGEDYEIETKFDGEGLRIHAGYLAAGDALCDVVSLTDRCLFNRGETPPPVVDPRKIVAVILLGTLALFLLTLGIALQFGGDGGRPTAPVTWSPAISATPSYDMPSPTPGATR